MFVGFSFRIFVPSILWNRLPAGYNDFDMETESTMTEHGKHPASRKELRERIIEGAVGLFAEQGIRGVTMDDIAASFGISKRTLYEVFSDKESLLMECVRKGQEENEQFLQEVQATSDNVLEVILKGYQRSIEKFHATNKRFFDDIKKYPRAYELIKNNNNRSLEDTINFLRQGVEQGIFRSDVNFAIVSLLVREQLNLLMGTDICTEYPFVEVYEAIMFTFLRGISTERGAAELECFIHEYRKKQHPEAGGSH